jgi:hypothetical protein
MSSSGVVSAFWAAMQANDWHKAATYLGPDASSTGRAPASGPWGGVASRAHQIEYWRTSYAHFVDGKA